MITAILLMYLAHRVAEAYGPYLLAAMMLYCLVGWLFEKRIA